MVAKFSLRLRSDALVQVPPAVTKAPLFITNGPSVGTVFVPIPTLPLGAIVSMIAPEDEATVKGLVEPVPVTAREAMGEVVPMPTLPAAVTRKTEVPVEEARS